MSLTSGPRVKAGPGAIAKVPRCRKPVIEPNKDPKYSFHVNNNRERIEVVERLEVARK